MTWQMKSSVHIRTWFFLYDMNILKDVTPISRASGRLFRM